MNCLIVYSNNKYHYAIMRQCPHLCMVKLERIIFRYSRRMSTENDTLSSHIHDGDHYKYEMREHHFSILQGCLRIFQLEQLLAIKGQCNCIDVTNLEVTQMVYMTATSIRWCPQYFQSTLITNFKWQVNTTLWVVIGGAKK